MSFSLMFVRVFFILISMFFMTTYTVSMAEAATITSIVSGLFLGVILSALLISLDVLFRKLSLRSFNVIIVGLFLGYLLGLGITNVFNSVIEATTVELTLEMQGLVTVIIMLLSVYLGLVMTFRASEELAISVPFVKLQSPNKKQRELIVSPSILTDHRIIDLATSGFLDHRLIVPRFIIQELYDDLDSNDENINNKGRQALEILKKLEAIPHLNVRYEDTFFPEVKTTQMKLYKLAKLLGADILTSNISNIRTDPSDDFRVINMQALANAFKPLLSSTEAISIKVQRYGKEPRQGVGYLEDGTMVVINGGGEYIGQTIEANVLSVKHTSSGRIIFCNAENNSKDLIAAKIAEKQQQQQERAAQQQLPLS